jgi:hypothetical protein
MVVEPATRPEQAASSPAAITLTPPQHDTWYLDRSSAPSPASLELPLAARRDAWFLEPSTTATVASPTRSRVIKDRWFDDVQPASAPAVQPPAARDRWYLDGRFGTAAQQPIPTHDDWAREARPASGRAGQDGAGR